MSIVPQISGREMVKILRKAGFYFVDQESSHIKLRRKINAKTETVIVPNHKIIRKGTFRNILKLASLSLSEFLKLKRSK